MSLEERPELEYVTEDDAETIESDGVIWHSGVNANTTTCDSFEYGTGRLQPGGSAPITPGIRLDEATCEKAALVTRGEATAMVADEAHRLGAYDCLFVPAGGEYAFENRGDTPVEFLWGIARPADPAVRIEIDSIDHGGNPQVVHTLRDIDVAVTIEPGHCSSLWMIAFPETVGSTDLTMGVISRPPGSVAALHEHDPSTLTEAFTVLEGQLLITDQDGRETVLDPGEFMYIPERGMHRNKSVHMNGTTYAFIEHPARGRDDSPFNMADALQE